MKNTMFCIAVGTKFTLFSWIRVAKRTRVFKTNLIELAERVGMEKVAILSETLGIEFAQI